MISTTKEEKTNLTYKFVSDFVFVYIQKKGTTTTTEKNNSIPSK